METALQILSDRGLSPSLDLPESIYLGMVALTAEQAAEIDHYKELYDDHKKTLSSLNERLKQLEDIEKEYKENLLPLVAFCSRHQQELGLIPGERITEKVLQFLKDKIL